MLKVKYGDVELTQWITVLSGFTLFDSSDTDIDTADFKGDGVNFLGTRRKYRTIKVPFFAKFPTSQEYDSFVKAISPSEPQKLVFSHMPDRYFMAIRKGNLAFKENRLEGKGTLTFLVPDGLAHSIDYKKFVDFDKKGNKLTFTVLNKGNVNAHPIIRIKHNSENGYIGLANQTGAFALGSSDEQDGVIKLRNEVLFDFSKAIASSLNAGKANVATLNYMPPTYDTQLKKMRIPNVDGSGLGGEYVVIGARGKTPNYLEHVGTLTFDLKPDSNGEYTTSERLWWQQVFTLGKGEQDRKGFLKICVTGLNERGEDEFLYGVETYKRKNGFKTEYNFFGIGDDGGWHRYKYFDFMATRDRGNPFSMKRGRCIELTRHNTNFSIYWDGIPYSVNIPAMAGKVARKVHVAMGTCRDSSKYISTMLLEKLKFEKLGVSHYEQIVNKYQAGDEVLINFETDTVVTAGIDSLQDMVFGSQILSIPPGESQLVIQFSDWMKRVPEISIEFKEGYL